MQLNNMGLNLEDKIDMKKLGQRIRETEERNMYYAPVKTGARIRKARMEMKCIQQEMAVKQELGFTAKQLASLEELL